MEEPSDASNGRKKERGAFFTCTFMLHTSLFAYWIFVHVHESSLMTIAQSLAGEHLVFSKTLEFPGRWKFLTIVNMWLQAVFFCFSFFGHFLPNGRVQKLLRRFLDMMFTTVVFPTTFLIFSVFWPIYLVDSDSIYPNFLHKILPSYLNHLYHSAIIVTALLEVFIVRHRYPGTLLGLFFMGSFNFAYLCVMTSSLLMGGAWPYRFMHKLSPPGLFMFFAISFLLYIAMYYIGKMLSHLRWGERLRQVKED